MMVIFFSFPEKWDSDKAPPEVILVIPAAKQNIKFSAGDHVICHTERQPNGIYLAKLIKKVERLSDEVIGFYERKKNHGVVTPTDRKNRNTYQIMHGQSMDAKDGDLVQVTVEGKNAKISKIIGHHDDADIISLIAIHSREIPVEFLDSTIAETADIVVPDLGKRTDLRDIPLITIDGADARDFDDAVYAQTDTASNNEGVGS